MNLSEKIRYLMKRNNIKNAKELSNELKKRNLAIPYTTLLTILNDEVQDIKLSTAKKICNFFSITLDELIDDNVNISSFTKFDTNGLSNDDIKNVSNYINFLKAPKK